eukprot:scaffold57120_cov29-Tisochrysis_lutea.AAC.3
MDWYSSYILKLSVILPAQDGRMRRSVGGGETYRHGPTCSTILVAQRGASGLGPSRQHAHWLALPLPPFTFFLSPSRAEASSTSISGGTLS